MKNKEGLLVKKLIKELEKASPEAIVRFQPKFFGDVDCNRFLIKARKSIDIQEDCVTLIG